MKTNHSLQNLIYTQALKQNNLVYTNNRNEISDVITIFNEKNANTAFIFLNEKDKETLCKADVKKVKLQDMDIEEVNECDHLVFILPHPDIVKSLKNRFRNKNIYFIF